MMDEKEFKKLTSNGRDWLIYSMLSEKSKNIVEKEIKSEHVSGVNTEISGEKDGASRDEGRVELKDSDSTNSKPPNPKGETTVEETVTGKVVVVTKDAVLIGNADRVAWFPKSVIENLDKIVLDKDKIVELKIVDWFKYKIEWKVPTQ